MSAFGKVYRSLSSIILQVCRSKHYGPPQPYVHGNPMNIPKSTPRKFSRKHWSPLFRRERNLKIQKISLPDFQKERKSRYEMTPAEIRTELKEQGIVPEAESKERTIYMACSPQCFEMYIPPEGDGKANILSIEGAKQSMKKVTNSGRGLLSVRKIKAYDDEFKSSNFPDEAKEIYIKMHAALCDKDVQLLHKYCTEKIFPVVIQHSKLKTIRWSLVRDIEPARVVHCRHSSLIEDDNMFAQITVRFHTQQTLAVYDRFGRLFYGSEIVARDCLEYIVFEKNISNVYGIWRVHHKIIPEWMDLKPNSMLTFKANPPKEVDIDVQPEETSTPPSEAKLIESVSKNT